MNPIKKSPETDSLCPHCGAINFEMAVYCRQCDRPLDEPPRVSRRASAPRRADDTPLPPPDDLETERIRRRKIPIASGESRPLVLQPVSGRRALLAFMIDILALLGVGASVTVTELTLRQATFEPSFRAIHDVAAEWLYVNLTEVQHGVVAAVVFGLLMGLRPGGRTLGRIVAGTVVVRGSGRPFNASVWILRLVGMIMSTLFAGLGFLWALFDPDNRCAHDVLAGTVSVRRKIHRASSKSEKA